MDLYHFAQLTYLRISDPVVKAASLDLMNAIKDNLIID